jgi:hypothetical protein
MQAKHYTQRIKQWNAFKDAVRVARPKTALGGCVYPHGVAVPVTVTSYMKRPTSDFA